MYHHLIYISFSSFILNMTERTGFIEVADANNVIFTGSKVEDFLIYTETSNQSILIGTLRSNLAAIEVRSNVVTINGKLGINTSNPTVAFEFNTSDALQIPKGTTAERPNPSALGQIRYNTSINTFEGFGAGNAWGSLGGVKDTNQDTYVSAESFPTSNDDIIRFFNSNNETMRIMTSGRVGISNQAPSERLELSGGNAKFNSNVYILERLGIANSNPTEALDVVGNAKIRSNLEVAGNLTVLGSTTTVDATTINIADNIIRLNNGASFISSLQAGIEVNRGASYSNYYIIYDEQAKYTKVGENGKLQVVATRDDDTPINSIAFYDSNNRKYTACNDFVYANGNFGLGTSNPDTKMEIIGTDALLIPKGTTAERPLSTKQGQIRYNTEINTFEGFGAGNTWGSLGGVKDTNQDTYVSAESFPTSNDDTLRFFNSNNETMRITSSGRVGISNQAPSERLELSGGNAKFNSNIYVLQRQSIGTSNPTESLDILGNLKASSNIYAMSRIGLGTSNPAYQLHTLGTIAQSNTVYLSDGTVSLPTITWSNDLDTGFYHIGNNSIGISTGGSNAVTINNNKVGINTVNPELPLDVIGTVHISSNIFFGGKTPVNSNLLFPSSALSDNNPSGTLDGITYTFGSTNQYGNWNGNWWYDYSYGSGLTCDSYNAGIFNGVSATSNVDGANVIRGQFSAITGSSNFILRGYRFENSNVAVNNLPSKLYLLGSFDSTNWSTIDYHTINSASVYSSTPLGTNITGLDRQVENTSNYRYYRVVFNELLSGNTFQIQEFRWYISSIVNLYKNGLYFNSSSNMYGINTSTPKYTLDITGDISSSNIYLTSTGTATNPSLTWSSSSNTGIYLQGQNMNLVSSSSNLMSLSNYRVGILSSQPTESLDVIGNTKIGSNLYVMSNLAIGKSNPQVSLDISGSDAMNIPRGTTGQRPANPEQGYIRYNTSINTFEGYGAGNAWGSLGGVKDTNQDTYISAESYPSSNDDTLRFFNSNNETMRITVDGRVGISNQAPSERLDVTGNIKANSNIYVMQNLAVGKSNPTNPLDVIGNTAVDGNVTSTRYVTSRGIQVKNRNSPFFSQGIPSAGTVTGLSNDNSGMIFSITTATPSNYFKFIATSNELLKLTGDGNLINNGWYMCTSNYGLCNITLNTYISPNTSNFGNWMIQGNALGDWNGLRFVQPDISVLCGSNDLRQFGVHYNGDGWALFLDQNKNLYLPGDVTCYWSDRRLKDNFEEIKDSHDVLQQLTGFRFNWNEKGQRILNKTAEEKEVGLIAQDVQKVIPQAVKVNKSGISLNNKEDDEYLTINYDKIVPFLIQGYKRHTKEIEELQQVIKDLTSKLEILSR